MSLKVGIDFGTSNSGVGVYDGRQVRVLPIDRSNVVPEVVKSILYITKDFKTTIGQEAVELYYKNNLTACAATSKSGWGRSITTAQTCTTYGTCMYTWTS